jgi:hypothetical protein
VIEKSRTKKILRHRFLNENQVRIEDDFLGAAEGAASPTSHSAASRRLWRRERIGSVVTEFANQQVGINRNRNKQRTPGATKLPNKLGR